MKIISYLQSNVVLQNKIHQLQEYNLIVDAAKTILDNSLIRRWIRISWHRKTETLDFYAFDVGMVTMVKSLFITKMRVFMLLTEVKWVELFDN